jgi:hypothetical protein
MIEPGSSYGDRTAPPSTAVTVDSDAAAAAALGSARRLGDPLPELVLRGGDLFRTLGGAAGSVDRGRDGAGMRFPVDLGVVEIDGDQHLFIAHAVLRRPLWSGEFTIAMNAQWCGPLDLGPRSHPGDGLLDITVGRLPFRQRLLAGRRARSGSHLPHPGLKLHRTPSHTVESERDLMVHLDGVRSLRCRSAVIRVEPDAVLVHI